MRLDEYLDAELLGRELHDGNVARKRHPDLPLYIYVYTNQCGYDRNWNDVTMKCRGLVVEGEELDDTTKGWGEGEVVAMPLKKFFNLSEYNDHAPYLPTLPILSPFTVTEKKDGSLGILFWYGDKWLAASKGSFISDQAQFAQKWLDNHNTWNMNRYWTYLAEIIYPENRIVVDYEDEKDLFLITVFDKMTGLEDVRGYDKLCWPGPFVETYPFVTDLTKMVEGNAGLRGTDFEGWVVRYERGQPGLRVKIKLSDYVRLHKLMTGLTERDVWRWVGADLFRGLEDKNLARVLKCSVDEVRGLRGRTWDELIKDTPDEWYEWVKRIRVRLVGELETKKREAKCAYNVCVDKFGLDDRGEFARGVTKLYHHSKAGLIFGLADGRDIGPQVYASLYPAASGVFKEDDDG